MRKILVVACGIGLWSACASPRSLQSGSAPAAEGLYPSGPLWAALWQQRAAEYQALCFQAYGLAAARLDTLLGAAGKRPPAVVTDIDETLLDNSAFTVSQARAGKMYSDSAWFAWTRLAAADTVPGALAFFRHARASGVAVFYISNRAERERAATLENLRRWGFPDADSAHLLLSSGNSDKQPRRDSVAQHYQVLLYIGDNLADFSGAFHSGYRARERETAREAARFGKDYIILPNPMYGDWEGALFGYRYGLSVAEKDSLMDAALRDEQGIRGR